MGTRLTRRTAAARIVGVLAGVATLIVLWFVALGLYTSVPGLMMVAVMAFGIGTVAATLIDPHWERNAAVVVFALLVLVAFLLLVVPRLLPPSDAPGVHGGPAVLPPPR